MNVLNKLTLSSLKQNKKRTIVTIIGVSLAVALIVAVTTFVSSFQGSIVKKIKREDGTYHIIFNNISNENYLYIKNNANVESSYATQSLDYAMLNQKDNELFEIKAYEPNGYDMRGIHAEYGNLPSNENEIAVPTVIYNGAITLPNGEQKVFKEIYPIGSKISLDLGSIDKQKYTEQSNYKNKQTNGVVRCNEVFSKDNSKEYTIVGTVDYLSYSSSSIQTIVTKLDKVDTSKEIGMGIALKKPQNAYKVGESISKELNIPTSNISYNTSLLLYEGVFFNSTTTGVLTMMASIVIAIILFTSIFVIRNSFNISLTEKTKQIGMLASIGATKKQIKKSILFEGFIIGAISIPIGIIVGILAVIIVLGVVNVLLKSVAIDNFQIDLYVSYIAIIISVILSAIMIFISSIKPARRATKISPIEAIRENNDIKISNKKLHVSKITKKLFGVPGEIATKNFKRSKKKYRTTIFSITLSIILFISMNSVIENGFKAADIAYSDEGEENIIVHNPYGDTSYELTNNYFNKILQLDNIEEYSLKRYMSIACNIDQATRTYTKIKDEIYKNDANSKPAYIHATFVSVGENLYKKYVKELGLNYEDVKDKGILYDICRTRIDGKIVEYSNLNIKSGGTLKYADFSKTDDNENEENVEEDRYNYNYKNEKTIKIALTTTKTPLGMYNSVEIPEPVIIISDKKMDSVNKQPKTYTAIGIKSNKPDKLQKDIEAIDETNKGYIYNTQESKRQNEIMVTIISIFLYGFIIVISIIGITNIFNTITTNMALRNREFAILKSIGMTNKEFKRMINYESLIYGVKSILYGIPIGTILSYAIYKVMSRKIETTYKFPMIPIIISIIVVFAVIFITMRYSSKKSEKINLIETIRNENQ